MSPKASKETVSQSFFLISLIASNLISTKIVFFVFFFCFFFFFLLQHHDLLKHSILYNKGP